MKKKTNPSLCTKKNWELLWYWETRENRPKHVDELALLILKELLYEDPQLKVGGQGDANPVYMARYLLGQD